MDDADTTVSQLKQVVRLFSEERDWDQFHNAKDLTIGVVTEASELLQAFRFKTDDEVEGMLRNDSKSKEVRDELADVFFFALRLAQKYDIDVSKSLDEKIRDNATKYPAERARGSNKKYTELKP